MLRPAAPTTRSTHPAEPATTPDANAPSHFPSGQPTRSINPKEAHEESTNAGAERAAITSTPTPPPPPRQMTQIRHDRSAPRFACNRNERVTQRARAPCRFPARRSATWLTAPRARAADRSQPDRTESCLAWPAGCAHTRCLVLVFLRPVDAEAAGATAETSQRPSIRPCWRVGPTNDRFRSPQY